MSVADQIDQIKSLLSKALAERDMHLVAAEKCAKEAEECAIAIAVLSRLVPQSTQQDVLVAPAATKSTAFVSGSIASRILGLLRNHEKLWWTANEIQDELCKLGDPVKMTSVSPNLSRLKDNGDIVRRDFKVALKDRALKNAEAPEGDLLSGNPSEASIEVRPYQPGEQLAKGREAVPGGGT